MSLVQNITQLPRLLYHGTTSNHVKPIADEIKLEYCDPQTDFGQGFYLTSNLHQAEAWAVRKENAHNDIELNMAEHDPYYIPNIVKGVVICFEVDTHELNSLRGHHYEKCTKEWANFIYANRCDERTADLHHNKDAYFHFVYGPVADGGGIMELTYGVQDGLMELTEYHEAIINESFNKDGYDQLSVHTPEALKYIHYNKVVLKNEGKPGHIEA